MHWGIKAEDQQPRMRRVCHGLFSAGGTEAMVLAICGIIATGSFVSFPR